MRISSELYPNAPNSIRKVNYEFAHLNIHIRGIRISFVD